MPSMPTAVQAAEHLAACQGAGAQHSHSGYGAAANGRSRPGAATSQLCLSSLHALKSIHAWRFRHLSSVNDLRVRSGAPFRPRGSHLAAVSAFLGD